MPDSTLRVVITGDSAGARRAFAESAAASEEAGKTIGDAGDEAATKFGDAMDDGTSRVGGLFKRLGTTMSNWGLPFGESVGKIGDKFKEADSKGAKFGQAMSTLGGATLLGAGAALAGVAVESIHLGENFQKSVAQIAANANIPVAAAQKIGNTFLDTAGKTIFSGQEMATAYASVAGQLGEVQGHALSAHQAMTVMNAAQQLAITTGTSLTSSTSALGSIMQAYQVKAHGAANVSTVLYNTSRLTGNGITAVANTLQRMHTQLGNLAPPISQTSALLVDLASHGETGRGAISALNSAMTTLTKPLTEVQSAQLAANQAFDALPPKVQGLARSYQDGQLSATALRSAVTRLTGSNATLLKTFTAAQDKVVSASASVSNLGVTLTDAHGKFIGLGSVISQLDEKLHGETEAQQMATLQQVFGAGASRKLLDVVLAGPAAYEKATKAVNDQAAQHKAAADQAKTLKDQLETLKATGEDLGVKIGDALIPKLEDLARDMSDVVVWFEKHKDVALALAGVISGVLATAVGVFAYGKLADLAKGIKGVIKDAEALGQKLASVFTGNKGSTPGLTGTAGTEGTPAASAESTPAASAEPLQSAGEQLQSAASQLQTAAEALSSSAEAGDTAATNMDASSTELATSSTDLATSSTDLAASSTDLATSSTDLATSSTELAGSATDLDASSTELDTSATEMDVEGGAGGATGALGKAGLVAGVGMAAYQGTSMLLQHTALGGAVTKAATGVLGLFGDTAKAKYAAGLKANETSSDVSFLESVASGKVKNKTISKATALSQLKAMGVKGYALGGVVEGPQLAILGEGGAKEAILPLGDLSSAAGSSPLPSSTGSPFGSTGTIIVIQNQTVVTPTPADYKRQMALQAQRAAGSGNQAAAATARALMG